jgi:CRISPR type III-A-associated protein Csm2
MSETNRTANCAGCGEKITFVHEIDKTREQWCPKCREKIAPPYFGTYLDKNGEVKTDLFFETAKTIVGSLKTSMKFSKLRSYYGEVARIWRLIENDPARDQQAKMEFKLLQAKAIYDKNRGFAPDALVDFFNKNEQIIGGGDFCENFGIFKKHFEAVIAFAKGELKS